MLTAAALGEGRHSCLHFEHPPFQWRTDRIQRAKASDTLTINVCLAAISSCETRLIDSVIPPKVLWQKAQIL